MLLSMIVNVSILLFTTGLLPSTSVLAADQYVPINGAMVVASGPNGSGYASTNSNGQYMIAEGIPTGTYELTTVVEGYLIANIEGISVTASQETGNLDFLLNRSGGISGKVTDSITGQPIPNLMITASGSAFGWYAMTDANGNYRMITNLATGTYSVGSFFPQGHVSKSVAGISVTAGVETKGVDLRLDPSGKISGKVTSSVGDQPLKNVTVVATSSDGKQYMGFATTDSSGNYKIDSGLGTGTYMVSATSGTAYNFTQGVNVVAGSETSNINIKLTVTPPPPSGTIRGRVTDTNNNPISGASVSATSDSGFGSAITDSNGDYEISDGLETGTYVVEAREEGYISQNRTGVSVTVGGVTSNVSFQLQKIPPAQSGRISGTVKGEANPLTTTPTPSPTSSPTQTPTPTPTPSPTSSPTQSPSPSPSQTPTPSPTPGGGGGTGIPGFPYEAIIMGVILGAALLLILQRKR